MIESRSMWGRVGWPMFSKAVTARHKAMTKKISNDQKIQRQESLARIKPVKVGPIAGANMITKAQMPIMLPIFFGGKICITIVNISGRIRPVPIPWIIRPANRTAKLGASAEIAAPIIKSSRAKITIWRVVNHLAIKLDSGKTIPITSM